MGATSQLGDLFLNLKPVPLWDQLKDLKNNQSKRKGQLWYFTNEIRPVDLYCYLYSKYGPPNGFQNLLRENHSDNLIHWEWVLAGKYGNVIIQGQNFRTVVFLAITAEEIKAVSQDFVICIKGDIKNHHQRMSVIRKSLEKWTEFVNPYQRIKSTVDLHFEKLDKLDVKPVVDKIPQIFPEKERESFQNKWLEASEKYSYAIGLTFGLRAMLPVLAESFVNFILFVLCRPEIKNDKSRFDKIVRERINVRVESLHMNCIGFESPVDYSSKECGKFQTLMNERNDLLHGNVDLKTLSFGEVYFNNTVPIFGGYGSFWDKSIGISLDSVKFASIHADRAVVQDFIMYVLSLLKPHVRTMVEGLMDSRHLGYNTKFGRTGRLFPEHMVDFMMGPEDKS